jgi:peroxiredoxin-like protein
MDAHIYEVNLQWNELRKGTLSSPVLHQSITVVTPPEFKGGIEGEWSPEHLFTASVSSCLMTTFLAIAENSKLDFTSFDCHATAKLETVDGVLMVSEILLVPTISLFREEDREKAKRVIEKSEKACLISNSMKSKIILEAKIELAEAWV